MADVWTAACDPGGLRDAQEIVASTSRADRISRSSPPTVISVPPNLLYTTVSPTLTSTLDQLAGLIGALARPDGQHLTLLGLLLGGVGNDETAGGDFLGLVGPHHDAVLEGLKVHWLSLWFCC